MKKEKEEGLVKIAEALQGKNNTGKHNMCRPGLEENDRIRYFYASHALFLLTEQSTSDNHHHHQDNANKQLIGYMNKPEAVKCLSDMAKNGLIHRIVRVKPPKGTVMVSHPRKNFFDENDPDALYSWDVEPAVSNWNKIAGLLVVIGALAVTMFKLWPMWLKTVVWYISFFALIFLLSAISLHFLVHVVSQYLLGYDDFYVFPYLFHDDPNKGILDAFKPLWGKYVDHKLKRKKKSASSDSKSTKADSKASKNDDSIEVEDEEKED